jgi:hypothetical protein
MFSDTSNFVGVVLYFFRNFQFCRHYLCVLSKTINFVGSIFLMLFETMNFGGSVFVYFQKLLGADAGAALEQEQQGFLGHCSGQVCRAVMG